MTRRALVLSGGGAKGSFQIGAIEELILNRGLDFEILCGVSVGALNVSFLAQAPFDPIHPEVSLENLKNTFITLRHLWLEEIIFPQNPSRKKIEKVLKKVRYAPIVEIKPEKYVIRDALDFSPTNLMENYRYGKKVAASLPRSLP